MMSIDIGSKDIKCTSIIWNSIGFSWDRIDAMCFLYANLFKFRPARESTCRGQSLMFGRLKPNCFEKKKVWIKHWPSNSLHSGNSMSKPPIYKKLWISRFHVKRNQNDIPNFVPTVCVFFDPWNLQFQHLISCPIRESRKWNFSTQRLRIS